MSTEKAGIMLTVKIAARQGSYPDMPSNRNFKVKVLASAVPESVMVNGVQTDFTYDGSDLSLTVNVPETDCSKEKVLKITYPTDALEVTDVFWLRCAMFVLQFFSLSRSKQASY